MAEWVIEPFGPEHERDAFCCGKASLDTFLRSLVSQYEKRRLGRTYVAVQPPAKIVRGYYTLACGAVSYDNLPPKAAKKLPRHPVPAILLARLAVDQAAQGQGLGRRLLVDALRRCLSLAAQLGAHAVEVEAIDEQARTFYQKYGFVALQDNDQHLYLALVTIEDALEGQ